MGFELLSFLTKVLGGFNVPVVQDRVVTWLKEKGAEYPDLETRTAALADWITTTLAETEPALDPTTMKDTIYGMASDILRGTAGVDFGSWQGMG